MASEKKQVAAAVTAFQAVEKATQSAEAKAKQVTADSGMPDVDKKQAADEAAAWRKVSDAAKAALEWWAVPTAFCCIAGLVSALVIVALARR